MSSRYTIDPVNRIVRIDYAGSAGFDDWHRTFRTLLDDDDYEPGLAFLGDRRGCQPPSTEDVRRMLAFLEEYEDRFDETRWAVVGDQMAELGMVRMAQLLSIGAPVEVEYFWSVDEALDWLLDDAAKA
jgi:hypothetical protein